MFPDVLRDIILDYAAIWELKPWVPKHMLDWDFLIENPNAVDYMIAHPRRCHWGRLAESPNPAGFYYIRNKFPDLLHWKHLDSGSDNDDVIQFICERIDTSKIDHNKTFWEKLFTNQHAIRWVIAHPKYIKWHELLGNPGAANYLNQKGFDILLSMCDDECHLGEYIRSLCWLNGSSWALDLFMANIDTLMQKCQSDESDEYEFMKLCKIENNLNTKRWRELYERVYFIMREPSWGSRILDHDAIKQLNSAYDHHLSIHDWMDLSRNPTIFELRQPHGVRELL